MKVDEGEQDNAGEYSASGDPCINVRSLSVHYYIRSRTKRPGWRRGCKRKVQVDAITRVSFRIKAGEIVGFLGPNGAGKTTVLKCLCGLVRPSDGSVSVLGCTPHLRSADFLSRITLITGQRSQLLWDLPPMDTFLANKAIYRIQGRRFDGVLGELTEVLRLAPLLGKPVRQLSLGERARCELAAALLHEPQVLFLDEPTLGLDIQGQQAVRDFIRRYRERRAATILLTSHDMADVTGLADRVLLIDKGRLWYEGSVTKLVQQVAPEVLIRCFSPCAGLPRLAGASAIWREGDMLCVQAPGSAATAIVASLLADGAVSDLVVVPPTAEEVLRTVIGGKMPGNALTERKLGR